MTTDLAEESVLTVAETARILKVSPRAVYRAVGAGTLPAIRIGKTIRVSRKALDEMINGVAAA